MQLTWFEPDQRRLHRLLTLLVCAALFCGVFLAGKGLIVWAMSLMSWESTYSTKGVSAWSANSTLKLPVKITAAYSVKEQAWDGSTTLLAYRFDPAQSRQVQDHILKENPRVKWFPAEVTEIPLISRLPAKFRPGELPTLASTFPDSGRLGYFMDPSAGLLYVLEYDY